MESFNISCSTRTLHRLPRILIFLSLFLSHLSSLNGNEANKTTSSREILESSIKFDYVHSWHIDRRFGYHIIKIFQIISSMTIFLSSLCSDHVDYRLVLSQNLQIKLIKFFCFSGNATVNVSMFC